MARIRTIKPEFWKDEKIMDCKPTERLLFIGLWNLVDDYGRFELSPRTIRAEIFPEDELTADNVRDMLMSLSSKGLITIYAVEGREYFLVTNWDKHQRIDNKAKPKYPSPFGDIPSEEKQVLVKTYEGSEKKSQEGKGREREKEISCPVGKPTRTKVGYSEEFDKSFWEPYPRSPNMSKQEAWREWQKLDPADRPLACKAVEPFKRFLKTKPNLETVHACRFLSQRRFEGFGDVIVPKFSFTSEDAKRHII
jgi:hypothetical protein